MTSLRTGLMLGALAALLYGCGAGGGAREFDTATAAAAATAAQPADFQLTRSAPSLSSDGRQILRLFATVKGAGNVALAGVSVTFKASGTGVTLTVVRAVTDASGQAEATLAVTDPANRVVTVTAQTDGLSASTDVEILGTAVTVSGPASVVVNTPAVFQVILKDAAGSPVAGKPVQVSSAAGNPVAVSPAVTSLQGAVDLILTPGKVGADQLTVVAAGATGSRSVQVSSNSVAFDSPPASSEIVVGSNPVPVRVRLLENGVPMAGVMVGFTASRGTLGASSALTDGAGVASTTIQSSLAGRSLVTATTPNGTIATREIAFVADRAAKLELQASPSTVGVNLAGTVSESSQIIAVVRDLVDNPVKGVRVNFSVVDPSAGPGLSQTFALTDLSGRAAVTFYPGALATGANQIVVSAAVDCAYTVTGVQCANPGLPAADRILMTASRRALQIRIGTGNRLLKIDQADAAAVFNELPYGVLVTDSAGNPVPGVLLNATVVGLNYRKGSWLPVPCAPGEPCWVQDIQGTCVGEDANQNLLLDKVPFDEDTNGDGVLTPGNIAAAYFGLSGLATTATADEKGSAVLRVRYLRDRSLWASVRLRISASVPDGTEGAEKVEFWLPILSTDLTDPALSPPGNPSPYGVGACP